VKLQGSHILWNYDISLESMFCLIDLLRLVMKLNRKTYLSLERYTHMGD
jgi:hypothetical protein